MVLMEAAVLGLPIVSVAFDTIADSLAPGDALVVAPTVGGLADGMMTFLSNPHRAPGIDFDLYQREALDEFDAATALAASPPPPPSR